MRNWLLILLGLSVTFIGIATKKFFFLVFIFPLIILLCFPVILLGQQNPAIAQEIFDVNGVRTIVGPAAFFWDFNDAQYEVPEGGGKHSIFAHEFWFGGVDDGGNLRVAAMTYRQSGNDFWAGPCSDSIYHNPLYMSDWDRVWKINKSQIDSHTTYYNTTGYIAPEAIENWPAHGDTLLGQAFYLAPFVDIDNNGIYDASLGDYPDVKGDQSLYVIRNDIGDIHTESGSFQMGIEQHLMFYGYISNNDTSLHHTLFVNMKIFNRGDNNLSDFYAGTWLDVDLGYYLDDYVGCDVNRNLGYVYNGDNNDEGASGYGVNPPAQGLVYLNQCMGKFVYYNDNFTATGNPSSGVDCYNYLRGVWKDNAPMTYGGDGHGSGAGASSIECNYMFPGVSDPNFAGQEWTDVDSGEPPGDRRFLMSAEPVDLSMGDVFELDYAFVYARANTGGQNASVNLLSIYVDEIQNFYNSMPSMPCLNISAVTNTESIQDGELLKIVDVLGRETTEKKNQILFFIYDDRKVEKKVIIE